MTDPIVKVDDLRAAKMCTRGARAWAEKNGIDYLDFLHNGIPASVLEAKDDALGNRLAAFVRQREKNS